MHYKINDEALAKLVFTTIRQVLTASTGADHARRAGVELVAALKTCYCPDRSAPGADEPGRRGRAGGGGHGAAGEPSAGRQDCRGGTPSRGGREEVERAAWPTYRNHPRSAG
ncbi:hypothetical protein [Micromonospora echinaurantiaca]|uniref:hypothetical protein n=1 Tax=Micromonospora echinaurantiaca TaxID=47857 RepID=UPI001420EF91